MGRATRGAALTRKLGIAVLATLIVMVVAGAVLAGSEVHGFWKSIYLTLLTAVGSSNVEPDKRRQWRSPLSWC